MRVGDLARWLDILCPPAWAASWDNVGLLVGDPASEVRRCFCALDADARAVCLAADAGAEVLVAHHPAPFRPLRRLTASDPAAVAVWDAARRGIAIYAAHTNFDVHPDGVNRALSSALGLRETKPLRVVGRDPLYKLVVYVPAGHEDPLREALGRAGAGHAGRYSDCSFAVRGEGRFRPLPGAQPFAGRVGDWHRQDEWRLEVLVPEGARDAVLAAMRSAHPYEEVAYDLLRLENPGPARCLGLVGVPARPTRLDRFATGVAKRLRAPAVRFVGAPERLVRRVAVCGGSGADLAAEALAAEADVLVTADVRYHEARDAEASGLALVDPGHQATEAPAVPLLAELVRRAAAAGGFPLEVLMEPPRADLWRVPPSARGTRQRENAHGGAADPGPAGGP